MSEQSKSPPPLLEVENLHKVFRTSRWPAPPVRTVALDDVSLRAERGESIGIAGESGSGKSTLVGVISGLVQPDAGAIRLDGKDLYPGGRYDRRAWRRLQLVFQDPYTSLNPAMSLEESVAEPARLWHGVPRASATQQAQELLDRVGLGSSVWRQRPTRLSGGQRQRASIARALAAQPDVLVLDESVSALDVSIQAQILELLLELRRERNLTYLLVSHDISVIRLVCDRVVVMKKGEVVEDSPTATLIPDRVSHPYTRKLLEAVPSLSV